jgi:hypothetical protein
MTTITSNELELLRSRPHETNLWLSIYRPSTILACQVNNLSAAPGDRLITYDTVTDGSYLDIKSGMTMYIGTSAGANDIGKIRVRSATSTVITVAENSNIDWQDGLYLTVINFWEINAVYPRMDIPNPSDPTQQIWYKDYDIAYTNQNSLLGGLICMGSHYAGFIEPDTGTCEVYYTSSGTFSFDPTGVDFNCSWIFEGGTPTGSTSNAPEYVSYDTPGHYTTTLIITNNVTGAQETSYRHISIYDRPNAGTNNPVLNWEFTYLDGSRDMGGYQGRIKIREDIDDIIDGGLVVIFSDNYYGNIKQSIGGNTKNRQSIFFVGYILDGSISYNYEDSSMEFTVGSPTEVMKLSEGFAVALNSSSDPAGQDAVDNDIPSAWALMLDMDCKRALYHYLKWHSTVLMTNDFIFWGTDKYIEYFDADRESLYDAINNLMKGTLYGDVVCDRQGRIYAEVSAAAIDWPSVPKAFATTMNIVKQDWIGNPTIEEGFNDTLGYLEAGGIQFIPAPSGTFEGTSIPYLSCAPGTTPNYRGNVRIMEGFALDSQDDLNTLCGNIYAYINSKFSHVSLNLSGNYTNLDIAPQEITTLTIEANDTPRKLTWNKKSFHITEMSWEYNPQQGKLLPKLILHEITQGFPASTITIPPVPPVTDPGGGDWDVPPIIIPPFTFSGWLYIYHNGVFVAMVSGLNFVDSA